MEEEESMLEMKEEPKREYSRVQNVHSPSAFPYTWELSLGKSGIAPDWGLGNAWGWRGWIEARASFWHSRRPEQKSSGSQLWLHLKITL